MTVMIIPMFLFAVVIVVYFNIMFRNKISFLNLFEFIPIFSIIYIIHTRDIEDFYLLYTVLLVILVTQLWIRKKDFKIYNVVATTTITTYVFSQLMEYSYRMLVSEQVIEDVLSLNAFNLINIIFTLIILYVFSNLHRKLFATDSPLIDIGIITFNIVIFTLILFANLFFVVAGSEFDNLYTILFLILLLLAFIIISGYFGVFILERTHNESIVLMNDMKEVNAKSSVAYRKNHNTTNIFITVNHMLKVKQYDELEKYLNEINKGESS